MEFRGILTHGLSRHRPGLDPLALLSQGIYSLGAVLLLDAAEAQLVRLTGVQAGLVDVRGAAAGLSSLTGLQAQLTGGTGSQTRLADLDEVGVGDPAQRGRLLTERHWCGVVSALVCRLVLDLPPIADPVPTPREVGIDLDAQAMRDTIGKGPHEPHAAIFMEEHAEDHGLRKAALLVMEHGPLLGGGDHQDMSTLKEHHKPVIEHFVIVRHRQGLGRGLLIQVVVSEIHHREVHRSSFSLASGVGSIIGLPTEPLALQ